MVRDLKHPVWNVYDEIRTTRLNVKYYGKTLNRLKKYNLYTEILLAITTSTSIAGFSFLKSAIGSGVWGFLGAISVIVSLLKPLFKLGDRISLKSQIVTQYRALEQDLQKIRVMVEHQKSYNRKIQNEFLKVLDSKKDLIKRYQEDSLNRKLVRQCQEEVNRELPADIFYIPEGVTHAKSRKKRSQK